MAEVNGKEPHFVRPGELDDVALLPGIVRRLEVELKTDLEIVKQHQVSAAAQVGDVVDRITQVEKVLRKIDERLDRALARDARITRELRATKKSRRGGK